MKNTFGQAISVTIFGESHGECIGAVIDGICGGIEIDYGFIDEQLKKRRPSSGAETARVEADNYKIVSGVFEGKTTGTPIAIIIPNENKHSKDYSKIKSIARPSHADYTANCKYGGYQDYRGGGHFSGRITVALVCAGAILIKALKGLNIEIATHILTCAGVEDRPFSQNEGELLSDILKIQNKKNGEFFLLNDVETEMYNKIMEAKSDGDSVGGKTETVIYGMPCGVGEPWFDSVEGLLSHALFSIGGIKGVEFGKGFDLADMRGSLANDELYIDNDGKVKTKTNNNGGINGGITNGMPITFSCAVKPTPSISKKQESIDFERLENTEIKIEGRHDPAIIRRACVVIDSVSAIVACDLLAQRYGQEVFRKGIN
ncbi:MAG: chorismate synthase [Clostridia bacterium]|nr:chorismate synthase [Clostridia bacterium]